MESSLDADEKRILELYKQRDKAEKFIRALGAIFVCFLATSIYSLTVKILKSSPVNLKLLNLTLAIIYPKNLS